MTLRLKINLIVGALTLLFVVRGARAAAAQHARLGATRRSWRPTASPRSCSTAPPGAMPRRARRRCSPSCRAWAACAPTTSRCSTTRRQRALPLAAVALQGRPRRARLVRARWWRRRRRCSRSSFPAASSWCAPTPRAPCVDAWDDFVVLVRRRRSALLVVRQRAGVLAGRARGAAVRRTSSRRSTALQAGRFDVALPPLPGAEAAAIGAAFNRMVGELRRPHRDRAPRGARRERSCPTAASWRAGSTSTSSRSGA